MNLSEQNFSRRLRVREEAREWAKKWAKNQTEKWAQHWVSEKLPDSKLFQEPLFRWAEKKALARVAKWAEEFAEIIDSYWDLEGAKTVAEERAEEWAEQWIKAWDAEWDEEMKLNNLTKQQKNNSFSLQHWLAKFLRELEADSNTDWIRYRTTGESIKFDFRLFEELCLPTLSSKNPNPLSGMGHSFFENEQNSINEWQLYWDREWNELWDRGWAAGELNFIKRDLYSDMRPHVVIKTTSNKTLRIYGILSEVLKWHEILKDTNKAYKQQVNILHLMH